MGTSVFHALAFLGRARLAHGRRQTTTMPERTARVLTALVCPELTFFVVVSFRFGGPRRWGADPGPTRRRPGADPARGAAEGGQRGQHRIFPLALRA